VRTYVVDWPEHGRIPAVGAVPAASGARVKVVGGSSTVSSSQRGFTTRTITVTSANGAHTRTYTVGFRPTERHPHRPGAARDSGAGTAVGGGGLWTPAREWEPTVG
jgi:hypothetical protein